ncbi:helix-turn-helix transcriptional regulator [Methylocapsa sp. S129]|uniref:helix-turn-helix transcriptional regulator n=1 Tax=Methylocapsa sp. S129 TaxID=1641869 RepID=UPI001FEF7430|nr:helix-turn-helix transcriptional regulator [Methylocapsa sp. S129]
MQEFSALIGDIYDTVLDGSLWPDVLEKAGRFAGGPGAALWSKDAVSETGDAAHFCGFDPGYVQAFFDEYIKLDPSSAHYFLAGVGEPVAHTSHIPHSEFLETRFYREWSRPQGFVDCVQVTLDKSPTSLAMFGVSRHRRDGVADDETSRRMRLLAPHLRRAVLVGKAIDFKSVEVATFAETFDGLRAAMFLVDAEGRIMHANVAGRALLADSGVLRAAGGQLVSGVRRIDERLRDIFLAAAAGDVAIGAQGVALPLVARDGERHVAHVLPLTSGLRAGASHAAAAAVFVRKAALDGPAPLETMAKAYKLTPTELRVLLAIVEVGGAADVADALGVAASTVKTHLGRVFEKTGAARQADLVKLVAGFSSPLVH